MEAITIRNLYFELDLRLRARTAKRGKFIQEKACSILTDVIVEEYAPLNLASIVPMSIEPENGVDLELPRVVAHIRRCPWTEI